MSVGIPSKDPGALEKLAGPHSLEGRLVDNVVIPTSTGNITLRNLAVLCLGVLSGRAISIYPRQVGSPSSFVLFVGSVPGLVLPIKIPANIWDEGIYPVLSGDEGLKSDWGLGGRKRFNDEHYVVYLMGTLGESLKSNGFL